MKLSDKDIHQRIGKTEDNTMPEYPQLSIDGKRFETSQIRRKVPVTPNQKHPYWYACSTPHPDSVDADVLKQLSDYVQKQLKPASKSVTVTSKDDK